MSLRPEVERAPFRIVVLSPLSPRGEISLRAELPASPVAIDKRSFDAVMEKLAPAFFIEAPDPFDPAAEALRIELRWPSLKALRPNALVAEVPVLRALMEAHAVLQQAKERRLDLHDVHAQLTRLLPRPAWVQAVEAVAVAAAASTASDSPTVEAGATAPANVDALAALFEKVSLTPESVEETGNRRPTPETQLPTSPPSAVSALIAAVARGPRTRPARSSGGAVPAHDSMERVERAVTTLLRSILQHPDVRQLERAWRGVHLLVDRADPRAGVEIDVLSTADAGIEEALALLEERRDRAVRAPVDLIIVDHEVRSRDSQTARLRAWGRVAAGLQAPLVVNGHEGFFAGEPALGPAESDDALRWVSVAMNGPLVRAAYSASAARIRSFAFAEAEETESAHVFAGASLAVAVLAAQSYVESGWGSAIVGAREGRVENLPVREIAHGSTTVAIAVERLCSDDDGAAAARSGIAMFTSAPNDDAAILLRAPMICGSAKTRISLGDQLFVGRLAHAVEQLASALPAIASPAAAERLAIDALSELFHRTARSPEIRATFTTEMLEITVRPHRYAGITLDEVTLAAPLQSNQT